MRDVISGLACGGCLAAAMVNVISGELVGFIAFSLLTLHLTTEYFAKKKSG